MNDRDHVIARGQRAQMAMDEFFAPAFDAVVSTYTARLEQIATAEPWAADKIVKLALANRVAKEVRAQIEAVIHEGKVADADKARSQKIEQIPLAKRKFMGLAVAN